MNEQNSTKTQQILITDDEKSIRLTLSIFLKKEGYTVDTAENAEEALEKLSRGAYDVVLTDIIMPQMSGVDLLTKIKEIKPDIPIIMMTGDPSVETAIQAVQQGAFDYVSKPVTKQILLKVVSQAVQLRKLLLHQKELEEKNRVYQKNLEKMVHLRTNELEKALQGSIKVLLTLVDSQDPYTAGHQQRVGNLAAAIAEEMGLADKIKGGLRVTGYLHDIGKMSIPAEILVKPRQLTHFEFEIVKTHAVIGYDILKTMDLPWQLADIVWQHHERLDGSGYPRGLTGHEISFEAKILAVADVVEAMESHRPYRASLGISAALEEIENKQSILYDPDVVQACLRLFREKNFTIEDKFIDTSLLFD